LTKAAWKPTSGENITYPARTILILESQPLAAYSSLERRAGIEPANTGFADPRVDRFATGAFGIQNSGQQRPATVH
jgi:hypothetical protein